MKLEPKQTLSCVCLRDWNAGFVESESCWLWMDGFN
jgi:hypothetical protein